MGTSLVSNMGSTCPYDIGDILQTTNSKNPSERWNGTEWTQIKGRFLLGTDDSHTIGTTGGEFKHALAIDEMPKHNHYALIGGGNDGQYGFSIVASSNGQLEKYAITDTGGSSPHNITPPTLRSISGKEQRKSCFM